VEVKVEVPTEKEVYITNDSQVKELSDKITKLEDERNTYKKDAENFQKELNDTLQKLEIEQKKNKRDLYGE
jgi:seryl-tRNA synthetase